MRAGGLRTRADKRRRKRRDLTVEAVVAATAVELGPSVVLTGDQLDLERLVDGFDVKVSVV